MTSESTERDSPYDRVPYDAGSEPRTRPDRLAVISWLNGGPRPPVHDYRLLELGCGNGANLLPMAYYHPDALFVGIDASPVHVAEARRAAEALKLRNLTFEVMEIGPEVELPAGPFEYILAHGLFSWVTEEVRAGVLATCRDRLAPDGVAYISYNVLPGWQTHGHLRGILMRSTADIKDPVARAERAAEIAGRLHELIAPDIKDPLARKLRELLADVSRSKPFYMLAEYLSEENVAFEFREFVELAASYDLVHIADADYYRITGPTEELRRLGIGALDIEQTLDLLGNRRFRASLLSRAGYPHTDPPDVASLEKLSVGTLVVPTSDAPVLDEGTQESFDGMGGKRYLLSDTVSKVLLTALAEFHPQGVPVTEAVHRALERLGVDPASRDVDLSPWCGHLVALHNDGCVELRMREPALRIEGRVVHNLAKLEAQLRPYLTTPLHTPFEIDGISRRIIDLLDGHHELNDLVEQLVASVARGETLPDLKVDEAVGLEPVLVEAVEMTVRNLGRWGLMASN